jgi:hypothetical protein
MERVLSQFSQLPKTEIVTAASFGLKTVAFSLHLHNKLLHSKVHIHAAQGGGSPRWQPQGYFGCIMLASRPVKECPGTLQLRQQRMFATGQPHPSILLQITDVTTRKVLILYLQEIKLDIVYRHAQLQEL